MPYTICQVSGREYWPSVEVQEAAAQLRMDTIYLLAAEGGDHE
jgi:hypothetical protein